MSAILKFDFQKREQLRLFVCKLSNLHKKDPILRVATTYFLKQGETRTSHGPIQHTLKNYLMLMYISIKRLSYFSVPNLEVVQHV